MEIVTNLDEISLENCIIILGKFDGFHRGHARLLEQALKVKKKDNKIVLFTFDIYPLQMFGNFKTIYSRMEREILWRSWLSESVDYIIEFPFNAQTMAMKPESFVHEILVKKLGVCRIFAGPDFHFGKGRSGNIDTLKSLGNQYHFEVTVVEKVTIRLQDDPEEKEISSTLIKQAISRGHMKDACKMLGRPYSITGTVIHGKHLGTSMGFPTINIDCPEDKVLPPSGVYYTRTFPESGKYFSSITNVGIRPSIDDGDKMNIETNLFGFEGNLYGRQVRVEFLEFIRPERKFDSIEELVHQIDSDKKVVLSLCNQ